MIKYEKKIDYILCKLFCVIKCMIHVYTYLILHKFKYLFAYIKNKKV